MIAARPFGPAGELAASRHGALSRSQAATSGLSNKVVRRLLRDEVLFEPLPGVLVIAGSPDTWHRNLSIVTLASKGAGVAATRSAAALHGIDGHGVGALELLVPSARTIRMPGLVMRQGPMDAADIVKVDGIPCTGIARTLCDLAAISTPLELKVAFEWVWRSGHSLTWVEQTARRLALDHRRSTDRVLDLVANAKGSPTESALEVGVESVIASTPGLVRQFVVTRADGSFVARVDFAIPALKIAIEAHSRRHHFAPDAVEADGQREAALHGEGWIVRFITDAQRRRPEQLRSSLAALIDARSASAA